MRSMSIASRRFVVVVRAGALNRPSCCDSWRGGAPLSDGRPPRGEFVLFEVRQDLARARDDLRRQPRQPRHLDAVAAVGSARDDLAQEDDVVLPLARGHVIVDDARRRIGQIRQLVIVRGEQRPRPRRADWSRGVRPRPTRCSGRRTSPCRGRFRPAPPGCASVAVCRMRAVSRISTMNVECPRAMLSEAPTRAKMRSTIGSLACARGHERSGLRHQADAARSDADTWTCRPCWGRSGSPAAARCRRARRRSARTARPRQAFHDGMARVGDATTRRRADVAAWCSRASAAASPSAASTSSVASARAVSWMRGASAAIRARRSSKMCELAFEDLLVGAEHLLFVFLQRRRDEAFAAGDRLLAVVVGRHGVQVRPSRSRCSSRRRGCSGSSAR